MEFKTLSNGVQMPILGYGVYQVTRDECERCVSDALRAGYRHTRRLALYQVSVRRLLDFATPLPPLLPLPVTACGSLRLAVNTRDRTSTG